MRVVFESSRPVQVFPVMWSSYFNLLSTGVCHHALPDCTVNKSFFPVCVVILGLCQFENIGSVNSIPLPNINIYVSLYTSTFSYLLIACVYDVCVGICMPQYSCGGQRTTCWSWFSPSTTWISGTKLRSDTWRKGLYLDEPSHEL